MMIIVLAIIILKVMCFKEIDYDETYSTLNFRVHLNQDRVLLPFTLHRAVDVLLIHHGNMDHHKYFPLCSVKQRSVITEVQELTIIQDNEFKESDFDPETHLNLRQFVFMSQINDGIIAVSSDMIIYMLKFNYTSIHGELLRELKDESLAPFARLIWKGDLQKVAPSHSSKEELPQLVYIEQSNLALLVYTDTAIQFSVSEMEKNSQSIRVSNIAKWQPRKERGWTKAYENLIFSAVGSEGLDIYEMINNEISFLINVNAKLLFQKSSPPLIVKDITFTYKKNKIIVFIMEQSRGIIALEITKPISIKLLMKKGIGYVNGGQSLDTYDGKSIFAVYKNIAHYEAIEYLVDLDTEEWEIIQNVQSRSKIVDVRVNEDFAVLQGLNHHQIIFYGIRPQFLTYSIGQKIIFEHGGLREFDFFKTHLTYKKDELLEIQEYIMNKSSSQQVDDFIFGITSSKIFLMKYKITSPYIACYTEDASIVNSEFLYTAIFNTTTCPKLTEANINSICHNSRNFTVNVVQTFLYRDKLLILLTVFGLVIIMLLSIFGTIIFQYYKFKGNSSKIQIEIEEIKSRASNNNNDVSHVGNQLQFDQSVDLKKP